MRLILIAQILCLSYSAMGQAAYSYGFNLAVGASRVPMSGEGIDFNAKVAPSGLAGLFFLTKLKTRGLLGVEVNISQVEGRWSSDEPILDGAGNTIGTSSTSGQQHITYVSLPIYTGITIKSWSVYGGLQVGLAASGKRANNTIDVINGSETTSEQLGNLSIILPDAGVRAGVIWRVSNKISLEAKYYQGLLNIFDKENTKSNYSWFTQQLTIGARFAIRNTNDCGTCPAWN